LRIPVCWVEIEVFDFSVLKEGGEADSVVGQVGFLAEDGNVILSGASIVL
jgi:hypothetical protein